MKFFRKKSSPPVQSGKKTSGVSLEDQFYSRRVEDPLLDDYFDEGRVTTTQRTSRHSPARRRESSNRASSWTLAILLLRGVLIVLLLVGGFMVLKLVLGRMAVPTEKERQEWETNAARMEQQAVAKISLDPVPQELRVSPAEVEQRLAAWEQGGQLFRSAEALSRRGINEEAAHRLEQALRVVPNNRAVQHLLSEVYMALGHAEKAAPLYIYLLDQEGPLPELQIRLLQALQESGQIEAGLVLANRILQDQPDNEFVLSVAAAGQAQLGDTDAALVMFERMLETSATNTVALSRCGEIYAGRGDYERAIPYYLELIRLNPLPDYYQVLANCYAQQNQAGQTVVSMGQAASLFGSAIVAPWLKSQGFDPVRESVEFRSFADRIIGAEQRKAIEAINKRDAEKAAPEPGELELPKQPELQLKPNQ
jgi:tetratricopeptide (TPR) repeat protein